MKRNVLLLATFFLLCSSVWFLIKVLSFPPFPYELLLNEESYYQHLNRNQAIEIFKDTELIMLDKGKSSGPRIMKAYETIEKVTKLFKKSNEHLDAVFESRNDPDSIRTHSPFISKYIKEVNEVYPKNYDKYSFDLPHEEWFSIPKPLIGLQFLKYQYEVQLGFQRALNELANETGSNQITFETFDVEPKGRNPSATIGQVAFNPPVTMQLKQKERIQVRLSKNFVPNMVESMKRTESAMVDSLIVGDIMLVRLLGDDFKITSFDDEEQGVIKDAYSQWEFEVTPLRSGTQDLYLKIGLVYLVPDLGKTKKYLPVYEKQIKVEVTLWQQVAGFVVSKWEYILSTILIPLGLWIISVIKERRQKKRAASRPRRNRSNLR